MTDEPREIPMDEEFAFAEYRAVFRAAPDGILVVDSGGVIRDVNPRALEQFGYERDELIGLEVEALVPEAQRGLHREQRGEYTEDPHARPMGAGLDLAGRRKDGSTFPAEISLSPMETDEGLHVISVVRDVSERKRLRDFGVGALRAAEDERHRIARELHDDTAQRLAAMLVRLRIAIREEEEGARNRMLEEIREDVLDTAESVRRIARGLRPPVLDEVGVVAAIRSHVEALRKAYGFEIEVEADEPERRLSADAELALYRIVQEALANVVRHAGAERARVRLGAADGHVIATVEDDGRGFRLEETTAPPSGLGLVGMRERARNAGGRLEIDSEPGQGTRVRVELPYPRTPKEAPRE